MDDWPASIAEIDALIEIAEVPQELLIKDVTTANSKH